MYTHNECCCGCCCFVPIFPLGGTTVESTPNAPREIVTSVSTTRGDGRVFAKLLTVFTHESTSFLDCVIEGNEGTVPFIPYRAWEERSDWSESDSSIQPLLSSDWSESDSSIQPLLSLYGKFHALSRVSVGRWRVTRERCWVVGDRNVA